MGAEGEFADYFEALASRLTPSLYVAYLKSLRDMGRAIDVDRVARLLEQGRIREAVEVLFDEGLVNAALEPMRQSLRDIVARAGKNFYRDTPAGPMTATPIARVRFQVLDPKVIKAIEAYESKTLAAMTETLRETVRQAITEGLREGVNPREVARGLKDVLGLSPTQEQYIRNYRNELRALDPAALERQLTDGNFDRTVAAAIREGRPLTDAEIEKGVARYRANWKRWQAETVSRTVTTNAMREAQRMAWDQAIAAGKVEASELVETWITTLDGRERPAHHQMHGAQKAYDADWFVPGVGRQRYPGESEYNCRCRTWIAPRIRRASELTGAPPSAG